MNNTQTKPIDTIRLPEGKTCADCRNVNRCASLFGVSASNSECDFHPSRFSEREKVNKYCECSECGGGFFIYKNGEQTCMVCDRPEKPR